jgi:hypothetical protein
VDFALVYRSPVLLSGQPPAVEGRPEGAWLGDRLALTGYALGAERIEPGQALDASLIWQAVEQLGLDYEFEVRLVAEDGQVVWQQAGQPFEGRFPTSWWRPGHAMVDRYRIELPAGLAPGAYWLTVSARNPANGQALAPQGMVDGRWPDGLAIGPLIAD